MRSKNQRAGKQEKRSKDRRASKHEKLDGSQTKRAQRDQVLWSSVIVLATVLAYIPALQGSYVWDDDSHLTANLTVRSLDGLRQIWFEPGATWQYYPAVFSSFWVEYHLWGLRPFGYHLVNVLLHSLNAVLLWRLLRRLRVPGALLAAGLFALHPVHVESVAWITERKNVLSGAFFLGSLLAYTRFCRVDSVHDAPAERWKWYAMALVLFLCAVLSKTVTCSLPVIVLLILWWKRNRVDWREFAELVPFFAAALALGLTTVWVEKRHVGASGAEWSLSFVERCLVAGRAVWFYAAKLMWPHRLTFIYPRWRVDAGVWWQYLFPAATLGVIAALWAARKRVGRGPLTAVFAFVVSLAPALGFFDVYQMRYSFVADHFQYLASIPLIGLGAACGVLSFEKFRPGATWLGYSGSLVLCGLLGVLVWRQAKNYTSAETLWRDTLKKNPECWMAHNNLGFLLKEQARLDDAKDHFLEALRLKPDHVGARYNLGLVFARQGKLDEAIAQYQEALRAEPDFAEVHNSLGLAFAERGQLEQAAAQYGEALRSNPKYTLAHFNLGLVLERLGKVEEAAQHYQIALRLDPAFKPAQRALENVRRRRPGFE